ncbi:MAG: tetratricopeptide repeat protein [Candidatus Muirbacterium halophilum]|nr:tetratricopeptide repeat protein [Candidatus Muirbacterium halophilum]MCK9475993.1 tetratricopeptide repeat protein [Candidatus Muirbacterium halophilum]
MDIFAIIIIFLIGLLIYLIRKFNNTFDENKRFEIVDFMINKNDYVGAIKYIEDMKVNEPNNIELYQYLAPLYEQKKMYVRAVKCYDKLLELNHPENDHNKLIIFKRLSNIYKTLGLFDKYYIENKKILEIDPNDKEALFEIAYFLLGTGNYDKALEPFDKLTKLNPDYTEGLFYQGICFLSKKWFKEGKECFEKVLNQDENLGEAYFYYGYILKEYSSPEAIKVFEDAIDKFKDDRFVTQAAIASAVTAISQNLIDIAVTVLNKHLSYLDIEDERRKDFLYNLGWAYFFKGDIEAAVANWEEVSSLDMNYQNIAEVLNPEVNRNFEEMERIYALFSSNITYPTGREFINFKNEYDVNQLEQSLGLWKQRMIAIAKERGVYLGPVRSAKVLSILSKIKFKNISYKVITSLGYIIDKEIIVKDGVDFVAYKRGSRKTEKIFFRIRNWTDIIQEDHINQMLTDIKNSGDNIKTKTLMICGKFSKKAKEYAENKSVKLYDERVVSSILKKISDL